jgi:hypothetical protein
MHDGSNHAICLKEVPTGGRIEMKLHLGVKTGKTPKCQISSQLNILEYLLNGKKVES